MESIKSSGRGQEDECRGRLCCCGDVSGGRDIEGWCRAVIGERRRVVKKKDHKEEGLQGRRVTKSKEGN